MSNETTRLDSEITQIRVSFSIFPPEGYSQDGFDIALMDEAILILSEEEHDQLVDWGACDHCDPFITLEYESLEDAWKKVAADKTRLLARAKLLYENCYARAALREDVIQPQYDTVDERAVRIENQTAENVQPGEYKRLCDEQERLQGILDALAAYKGVHEDERSLEDVLTASEFVSVTGAA